MAITHAKSDTIADFTGTVTVYDQVGSTSTVAATDLVRPSDWNSQHYINYALSGNTAGSSVVSGLDITLVGGNNVTLSADTAGSKLVFSAAGGAGDGGNFIAAGTRTAGTNSTVLFSNSNGVTFGLDNVNGSVLTMDYGSSRLAGTGYTSTTTAGTAIVGTLNTAGLSLGVPAYLTTARASTDAVGLNTAQTNVTWTVNSSGISLNAGGYAGTATTFNGANISGSITLNSNGLNLSLSGAGGGTTNQTGPNIAAGTQTGTSGTIVFSNSNNITFGMSNSSVVTASFNPINIGVTDSSALGTTGTLDGAGAQYLFFGNSGINVSQSINGSSGSLSIGEAPRSSWVSPDMALSVLGAFGNGSFSIAYRDVPAAVSATRVDGIFNWVQATTANANTIGIAMTVLCGIYTRNASTLNTVSSASTQTTYTYASNTAGNTQLSVAAYRPVSLPMNVNMSGGQYYLGFGISTAATSIGTATTTAAQTISVVGVPQGSSAVPWTDEFTRVTATSVGMFSGHGIYSAAVASVVPAISLSAINQSGSYFHRANNALVFRG